MNQIKCYLCKKKFRNYDDLDNHIEWHKNAKTIDEYLSEYQIAG